MSNIRNSNLLYRPAISVWTARRLDRTQTEQVNENAGAVAGAARVNKQLLPECAELEAIQKFASGFRNWVYANTLPWDDGGARIGGVLRHMDFMSEVGDKMREFDALVDTFIDNYETAKANARFTLNTMFSDDEYPGVSELRGKFRISIDVMPLPDAEDLRCIDGITTEEADKLASVAAANVEARLKAGMDEAYERLFNVVAKMAVTLTQFGNREVKKFNDTLVGNIADIVAVMPALNIMGDPKLTALTTEAKLLLDYDLKDLRKDDLTRAAAIKDAQALVAKFDAIMGRGTTVPAGQVAAMPDVPAAATGMADLFADMMGE